MCGITGFFDTTISTSKETLIGIVTRMSDRISHRGPDDSGIWIDEQNGVALGFRRLAILDLTPTGHQPMPSADGRYFIVFNGEIYNFQSLRDELNRLGHNFRGTSDTEIMLASISQWGLKAAVQRFNGMFAFALWDRLEHTLSLVRDRLGIKPLYYGWCGKTLLFGSELKALRAHPDFNASINRDALVSFIRYSYIPAPDTIYRSIHKLPPASILTIHSQQNKDTSNTCNYWSANEVVQNGIANPFIADDAETINTFGTLLSESLKLRMIADVPLGAFLSGGIDSTTIVSLMQKQSRLPIRTFTIGFSENGFDEAGYARKVASHLRTDHTELYISPEQTREIIPRLPTLYDEPFADPSQIPTFLVSQLARQHVTVSLSGDGGDELFGGYNRYFWVDRLWKQTSLFPTGIRNTLACGLSLLTPQQWSWILKLANPKLPNPADKVQKLTEVLSAANPMDIYLSLVSKWKQPDEIVIDGSEPIGILTNRSNWIKTRSIAENMMALDQVTYLPDDILAKVDRASMGNSLEVRAPFLDDHTLFEFAWKLPLKMKIRNGQGKWILRQILGKYVPEEMINRPKMGFGVPIDAWLRGPLRTWANDLIEENRLQKEGFLRPEKIQKKWQEHLSGKQNWQYDLWNVLMFQSWLEEQNS